MADDPAAVSGPHVLGQDYDPAVAVDRLTEHPDNPRRGDVDAIAASMDSHGFYGAVVAQRSTGRILAGNHRFRVATEQGAATLPVIWLDVDDDKARRILLTDNRTGDLAEYDYGVLASLLDDLQGTDLGLGGTGWDLDLLAELTGDAANSGKDRAGAPGDHDEEVSEPPAIPVTAPGDVWHLGPHRLVCGDCTLPEAVDSVDGRTADLILTDPPYCSGGFQESGRSGGSVGTNAPHKQIANDRLSTRGYQSLVRSALALPDAPYLYVFTDWRMWVNLFDVVEASGFGVRSMIVWDKGSPGMGRQWRAQHELVLWAAKQTPPFPKHDSGRGNVLQASRSGNDLHTTQKPVDLLVALIENTPFAATVYDPFAGSGTTLIAAHQTGRAARLVELDPSYCDVICRRWQEHTGDVPVLEATGEPHDFAAASSG